jgi:DNA-directed DNA polymerase III PolC
MKHSKTCELPEEPTPEGAAASYESSNDLVVYEKMVVPWDPSDAGSQKPLKIDAQRLLYAQTSRGQTHALSEFKTASRNLMGDSYEKDFSKSVELSPPVQFIELLAQTNFSFLQGGSHPEEMILKAKRLGYLGLGICDTNGMYGVVRGFQATEKPSLFDAEQLEFTDSEGRPKTPFHYLCGSILTPFDSSPIALIPMKKEGYSRLCHLITKAKRKSPKGEITLSLNDICETSDQLLAFPLPPWTDHTLKTLKEAFGDRVYLPVHKDFTWESVRLFQLALKIEEDLGILPFATQRPLFHDPARKPLHDVLTCILHKTTLKGAATRLTLNRERYMKSPEQIAFLFRERPDLVSRTLEIARRVDFKLSELRYKYPQENLPKGKTATEYLRDLVEIGIRERYDFKIEDWKRTPNGTYEKKKLAVFLQKVRSQVDTELALIAELAYEDYFITLKEICVFAESRGILHQGRGSAANSVVCYALKLTNVCPIGMGLMFGRFLSRERAEPPDVDIDFEHARREEVLQHIYEKYGESRAAMVCTVVCYRSRMAIREVAKVMGLELRQIDALVKFMGREGLSRLVDEHMRPVVEAFQNDEGPGELEGSTEQANVNRSPIERESPAETDASSPDRGAMFDLAKIGLSPAKFQKLLHLSLAMQGFPRHLGIHSGGFVISNEPLSDIVPIETATKDKRFVIQWNKDDINTLGLMKLDMLSLGMLTAVKKAIDMLRQHRCTTWDMSQFPADDKPTYDMICEADTVGVFQIESRAQMSLLPRLRPKNYYDLVIEVAIVRPGPIVGGMVHPYLKRRHGRETFTYEHPKLEPILKKTCGVPLFQEQVMQIAVEIAGFTPGEADELRRVVSSAWKKKTVMQGLRQRVINGMLANNVKQEYAEQIFKTIEGFSSYGFPESHAASFALITYISCYLKMHHPDIFTCALLNSQPMGFYSPRQLIADAQRHGVKFHPLDVQWSHWEYCFRDPLTDQHFVAPSPSVDKPCLGLSSQDLSAQGTTFKETPLDIRVGFNSVYGLKETVVDIIVQEREARGHFLTLTDFIKRTHLSKAILIRLAAAGALQSICVTEQLDHSNNGDGTSPRELMWVIQGLSFDEKSLFFGEQSGLDNDRLTIEAQEVPPENEWQMIQREYQTKGFSLDGHPLKVLRAHLDQSPIKYVKAEDLKKLRHKTRLRVAGLISLLQRPPTAKGMAFASIEDETGLMNIVITPDVYLKCRLVIMGQPLLEVDGYLECQEGVYNVKAESIRPLMRTLTSGSMPARLTAGEVSYGKNV